MASAALAERFTRHDPSSPPSASAAAAAAPLRATRPRVNVMANAARARHQQRLLAEQTAAAAAAADAANTAHAAAAAAAAEIQNEQQWSPSSQWAPAIPDPQPPQLPPPSPPQRPQPRAQPADPHRLTLGPLATGEGFSDLLARMDRLEFGDFRTGDPATAGKRFAELVFDGLEWDRTAATAAEQQAASAQQSGKQISADSAVATAERQAASAQRSVKQISVDSAVEFKENAPAAAHPAGPRAPKIDFEPQIDYLHPSRKSLKEPSPTSRFFNKSMLPALWRSNPNNPGGPDHYPQSKTATTHPRLLKTQRSFTGLLHAVTNAGGGGGGVGVGGKGGGGGKDAVNMRRPSAPQKKKSYSMYDPTIPPQARPPPQSVSLPTLPLMPASPAVAEENPFDAFPAPPSSPPYARSHETLLMPPGDLGAYTRQHTGTTTLTSKSSESYTTAAAASSRSIKSRVKTFLSKPTSPTLERPTPPPLAPRKSMDAVRTPFAVVAAPPIPPYAPPRSSSFLSRASRSRSRSRSARSPPSHTASPPPPSVGRSSEHSSIKSVRTRSTSRLRLPSAPRFRSRSRDVPPPPPPPPLPVTRDPRTLSASSTSTSASSTSYPPPPSSRNSHHAPRKSLDASSRKSSDHFFEFVDELYCRTDAHGFVSYTAPKTRAAKLAEAAWIARDAARARKWKMMAREIDPPHPAVREAERRVNGGVVGVRGGGGDCVNVPKKVAIVPLFAFVRSGKFVSRLRKGVPQLWRGHAWYHLFTALSGLYDRMSTDQIGACEADLILKYHMYQDRPTEHDERILLAVPKTFANHIWFMQRQGPGQQALARLLTAFANHEPAITAAALEGGKHGSNGLMASLTPQPGLAAIAATLLTVMEEERAFIALVHLFYTPSSGGKNGSAGGGGGGGGGGVNNGAATFYNGRGLFAPAAAAGNNNSNSKAMRRALAAGVMSGPLLDTEIRAVHDALLATHVHPRVVLRLKELGIGTADYAAGWYAGLFLALCRLDKPMRRREDYDHDGYDDGNDEDNDDDSAGRDEEQSGRDDDGEMSTGKSFGRRDSSRMDVDSCYVGEDGSAGVDPMDVDGGGGAVTPGRRSSDDGVEKGKRWDGLLGFATVVRCWDFYAEVGWEGACVVAAAVIKWHEATLLSLPDEAVLPFLRGTGGARPADGGGGGEDDHYNNNNNNNDGTPGGGGISSSSSPQGSPLSSSPFMSSSSQPTTSLSPQIRATIRAVPAPDADRFMRLVRRMWDAR
ncbi:hypothetical protein HDU86_006914 [Geranomyces michiganensis]|nr:hypothetical protein HDU86_006914 [Geranomyces michiganensis]